MRRAVGQGRVLEVHSSVGTTYRESNLHSRRGVADFVSRACCSDPEPCYTGHRPEMGHLGDHAGREVLKTEKGSK